MNSYIYLFGILLVGFVVYYFIRDKIFDTEPSVMQMPLEAFQVPAPASIEIRQAPIYPERVVAPSGPASPSQAPPQHEAVIYGDPIAKDPYSESHESSDIPENLRHPERSFRPTPLNDNREMAVQSGIASEHHQVSSSNTQQFQQEFIQGGGEFMPGIFANDTFDDQSYSAF